MLSRESSNRLLSRETIVSFPKSNLQEDWILKTSKPTQSQELLAPDIVELIRLSTMTLKRKKIVDKIDLIQILQRSLT